MRTLYLASGSPRRRDVLTQMKLPFTVKTAPADESLPDGISPADAGKTLALRKATALKNALQAEGTWTADSCILAADTLVWLGDRQLGKPRDAEDAVRMLLALSGKSHTVCTGVCLLCGEKTYTTADETRVRMCAFTKEEARAYVATGEPLDKAGAYAMQGVGAALVSHIDGDFFSVMGLSPHAVKTLLAEAGISYFASL